jgi:UDP-N-acetylmuramoyl-tripeptide--D-alanyl-D-alanine ligase
MLKRVEATEKLSAIRSALSSQVRLLAKPYPPIVLFLSVSDGDQRAKVVTGAGASLEAAWQNGLVLLRETMAREGLEGRWLRVDWVDTVKAINWSEIRALLGRTKRNYFRWGISLDADFTRAFTEQELNANAMLYGGNRIAGAVLNERNFAIYAGHRFGSGERLDFGDEREAFLFTTRGVFCDETGHLHELAPTGLDAGRRIVEPLDTHQLSSIIAKASNYLGGQVRADGTFVYGHHPCFDRGIDAYNTLRHASTTYAMLEAWELTHDTALGAAIERSIGHLTSELIREVTLPDGTLAAFLVDVGNEIKLGGSAVAILALAKHAAITRDKTHLSLMQRLARGICFMQDAQSGAFVHVINHPDLTLKQRFRTIYYEGEAAFALMRLYELDGDERWISAVERAFDHFIVHEHWKHHDHWLGYCVNELTRHRPQERYFRFAIANVASYLDFVENRITTFPTLLELMMAARETIARIALDPELAHLLDAIDLRRFEVALEKRAHYLLNGHFWPEMALYFRKPDSIVGSFFIRHHAFRVRIDDVEHYLSGLIAYRAYLPRREAFRSMIEDRLSEPAAVRTGETGWTAANLEVATAGTWHRPPPSGWKASGLSTFAPACRDGDLVAIRSGGGEVGIHPQILPRISHCSGAITSDPGLLQVADLPVLQVQNVEQAVLAMGAYARSQMTGKVVGVTGSAGKTTVVAMLAKALSPAGTVAMTHHNANLPTGVAWNLASMDWQAPHVVLELAVGRMGASSRMARPHVAIFTNVLPAHLREGTTVADIAATKSAIYLGMRPGDIAIINRDMQERQIVEDAARRRNLNIIWYGTDEDCHLQLVDYDPALKIVHARIKGRTVRYLLGAPGRHIALNSLAVLGAVSALGQKLEPALEQLAEFEALPGRGETFQIDLDGRQLTIIDDAYNANPGSMQTAIERLSEEQTSGRRIAVLGEMAELGPETERYHTELAPLIVLGSIDRVDVSGKLYDGFWEQLPATQRGRRAETLKELEDDLLATLEDGDTVLFKASNSSGLHRLVDAIKERGGL